MCLDTIDYAPDMLLHGRSFDTSHLPFVDKLLKDLFYLKTNYGH